MTRCAKMKLAAMALCVAAVGGDGEIAVRRLAAAQPSPAPVAPGVTILDDNSYWRWMAVVKPSVVEAEAGAANRVDLDGKPVAPETLKKVDKEVPAKWTGIEFDDSDWPHAQGRALYEGNVAFFYSTFQNRQTIEPYRDVGLHCLRAKFNVTDPGSVKDLSLSLKYRGGIVVYLNGQDVGRASLPEGTLDAATPGARYPRDAYAAEKGKAMSAIEQATKRDRILGPLALPAKSLRQGVNVLAIEIHRSDFASGAPKVNSTDGSRATWGWAPSGVSDLRLATSGNGIVPNTSRPSGVQVWSLDMNDRATSVDFGDPTETNRLMKLTGVRNGTFSGKVVVSSDKAMGGVKGEVAELKGAGGQGSIPVSAMQIRYAQPIHQDARANVTNRIGGVVALKQEKNLPVSCWYEPLSDKAPDKVELPGTQPGVGAAMEVWLTVHVPENAAPGDYTGTLAVSVGGTKAADVPVRLSVADWTLPDPKDFRLFVGAYQSPTDLAMQYQVPEWSEEHWKLMEKSMALLGGLGTSMVQIPVVDKTLLGNDDGMVTWIRAEDGTLTADFSTVERYLKLVKKYLGAPKFVVLYVLYTAGGRANKSGISDSVWITVMDRKTGQKEHVKVSVVGTPEDKKFWSPVLLGLKERLAREGMEKAFCLGTLMPWGGTKKETYQMYTDILGQDVQWRGENHPRGGVGRKFPGGGIGVLDFYVYPSPLIIGKPVHEGPWCEVFAFRYDDWLYEARSLMTVRLMAARTLNSNNAGLGQFGIDYWHHAITTGVASWADILWGRWPHCQAYMGPVDPPYLAWPGPEGAEPMAAYEEMREGIQEAEAMQVVSKAGFDKTAAIEPALAERCRQVLLDEQLFYLYHNRFQSGCLLTRTSHYGWQELSQRLFTVAGEVAGKAK